MNLPTIDTALSQAGSLHIHSACVHFHFIPTTAIRDMPQRNHYFYRGFYQSIIQPSLKINKYLLLFVSRNCANMSYSDSDSDEYEVCPMRSNSCALPFDPTSLENIILTLCDNFDFRVILNDDRAKGALMVTSGLTIAGGLIGRHYGGKIGAAVGGAIGGVCGLGIVVVSMRSIWEDIKAKLSELFDIVYDYLAGLGLDDYRKAAMFLTNHKGDSMHLAMIIMETASNVLGKKILSSLTAA